MKKIFLLLLITALVIEHGTLLAHSVVSHKNVIAQTASLYREAKRLPVAKPISNKYLKFEQDSLEKEQARAMGLRAATATRFLDKVGGANKVRNLEALYGYGVARIENLRGPKHQIAAYPSQDRVSVETLCGKTLFAVCDGHGDDGDYVAQTVADALPVKVLGCKDSAEGFKKACADINKKLSTDNRAQNSGSTFVGAVIEGNTLTVANIGDSRLVVLRPTSNKPVFTTKDHKNGRYLDRRMGYFSRQDFSRTADISTCTLQDGDVIIAATDGFWDVVHNDELHKLTNELLRGGSQTKNDCENMAKELAQEARARKSVDDISVVVACFKETKNKK